MSILCREIQCDGFPFVEQEILNKLLNLPSFSLKFIYLLQGNRMERDNVSSV